MIPGETTLTRMPCSASSFDSTFVKATTPALVVAYAAAPPGSVLTTFEAILTTVPPRARHQRQSGLAHVQDAIEVDIEHSVPVRQRHIGHELPADGDASVIDQNIHPTQFPNHALNQRLRGLRLGLYRLSKVAPPNSAASA